MHRISYWICMRNYKKTSKFRTIRYFAWTLTSKYMVNIDTFTSFFLPNLPTQRSISTCPSISAETLEHLAHKPRGRSVLASSPDSPSSLYCMHDFTHTWNYYSCKGGEEPWRLWSRGDTDDVFNICCVHVYEFKGTRKRTRSVCS